MEQAEIQRRIGEARSRGDESYWEGWMEDVEWGQFVQAVAVVGDWDRQLKEMISQGYLPDHEYAVLYSPEAYLEGCRT